MTTIKNIKTDFMVVGSGLAGLCFALELTAHGRVTILTKKQDCDSNTNLAQGGIACVCSPDDSFESHVEDTLVAGAGLCHRDVVQGLVEEGPNLVRRLIEWGVNFTLSAQSRDNTRANLQEYDLGREGGHSHRRILHAHDLTGHEVEMALLRCLRENPQVTFLEHHVAVELLVHRDTPTPQCHGVLALDSAGPELVVLQSPVVLLSTGGLGQIYRHTTNPTIATGDGVAMAWRCGLPIANLEFVQFHPTSFYSAEGETFLISEAVRGEGAVLRRLNQQTFMEHYDQRGCLAPRDIVARAIDTEMKRHGESHVLLDCRCMSKDFFHQRFPAISELCRNAGVDPPGELIPVVPAAHYACGGVCSGSRGQTAVNGLYATGEVACTGIHGANRLASNSLLEALVFSHRAAQSAIQAEHRDCKQDIPLPGWTECFRNNADFERVRIQHCKDELQRLMWDYVGIVRKSDRLELAKERISLLDKEVNAYLFQGFATPAIIELRNMVKTAELVIESALCRRESRGLHYTLDYPETRSEEAHDTVLYPPESVGLPPE